MGVITMRMNTPQLTNRQIVVALVLHGKKEAALAVYQQNRTAENYGLLIAAIEAYETFKEERIGDDP